MFEANPVVKRISGSQALSGSLTYNGVINRTGVLLLMTGSSFVLTWRGLQSGAVTPTLGVIGMVVGLCLGLYIAFARATNPIVINLYALAQGTMLGTVSYLANQRYPGIALQAVAGTLGCFCVVLWLYSLRVLRATPMFTKIVLGAMLGIALVYVADFVAGWFGHPLEIVNGNSGMSLAFSGIVILVAAVSFVIDFATIERAIQDGADERYAWYFGFALLVGLIWLYMEMLRFLMKLRSRD